MPTDRYVLLGLSRAHEAWFASVRSWCNSAVLPAEVHMVDAANKLRVRLDSGRLYSAVVVDATSPDCDRDLVDYALNRDCAVFVVDDRSSQPWDELGVAAVLQPDSGPDALLAALGDFARPIAEIDRAPSLDSGEQVGEPTERSWRGSLVSVTGSPGTGRSCLAMALAEGLARDPRDKGLVALADLALDAQQCLLHDTRDVVPALTELVVAYQRGVPSSTEVRRNCFVIDKGYDVLAGLRRRRELTELSMPKLRATLDGLLRAYRLVVAEVDPEIDGEKECGLSGVEARNVLARTVLPASDLVLVVGMAGLAGPHAQVRVLRDLVEFGVPAERIVPVINRAPRHPRHRAELSTTVVELLRRQCPEATLAASPIFIPERRRIDALLRDGMGIPAAVVDALAIPTRALIERLAADDAPVAAPQPAVPERVKPGSLPTWGELSEELA